MQRSAATKKLYTITRFRMRGFARGFWLHAFLLPPAASRWLAHDWLQMCIHSLVYSDAIRTSFGRRFGWSNGAVSTLALELREIPRPALFLAAKAYAQYRKRGASKQQVPPDFFIGAHAAVESWPLLTRDASRLGTYFPTLEVIAP